MKIEKLKKSHKKEMIIGGLIGVSVLSVLIFATTKAKYRTTESINIAKGIVNYNPADLNLVAMYEQNVNGEYEEISKIPEKDYIFNQEKSYCKLKENKLDMTINYDIATKTLSITPMQEKGTKCYLYFDIKTITKEDILASLTKSTRSDFTILTTNTTGTIFTEQDDDGETYYYAGAVDNNWVKFAGYYWRIIRFNGDGSIRLIYNGATTDQTGETTQIGKSQFNEVHNDNMYVGYRYTSGEVHGLGTAANIQETIDNWYKLNIIDKGFSSKVDASAGFCGDREPSTDKTSSNGIGGTGTTTTYYGVYPRLFSASTKNNPTPTLKCKNTSDWYTTNSASKGNKSLTYPVGLITADEVNAAGAINGTANQSYYLYTGQVYWGMTPCFYISENAHNFVVQNDGQLYSDYVYRAWGIRPVINLKSDTKFTGDGTSSNPYVVR